MSLTIRQVIRGIINQDKQKNIINLGFNGIFERLLAQTQHKLYTSFDSFCVDWNMQLFPKPANLIPMNGAIPDFLDFDAVIINEKEKHYQKSKEIARALHAPIIRFEHTFPPENLNKTDIEELKNAYITTKTIFCHEILAQKYGQDSDVIRYGFDFLGNLNEKQDELIIYGNSVSSTFGPLIEEIKQSLTGLRIHNFFAYEGNGVLESHTNFLKALKTSKYFLYIPSNTVFPIEIILAMSYGCYPLAVHTNFIEEIFDIESCGMFFKNVSQLKECLALLEDYDKLFINLQNIIQKRYNKSYFIEKVNNIIKEVVGLPYIL